MDNKIDIEKNSQAIQTHLGILQNIIQRMASNSSAMKGYCITMVSAILVLVADKGQPKYAFIAIIPNFLFMILDTYYLVLEKGFRESYNDFINKYSKNRLDITDLYSVKPMGEKRCLICKSFFSFSIFGFYVGVLIMILIAKKLIID